MKLCAWAKLGSEFKTKSDGLGFHEMDCVETFIRDHD